MCKSLSSPEASECNRIVISFVSGFCQCNISQYQYFLFWLTAPIVWLLFSRKSFQLSMFSMFSYLFCPFVVQINFCIRTTTFQVAFGFQFRSEVAHFDFDHFSPYVRLISFMLKLSPVFTQHVLWNIESSQQLLEWLSITWINGVSIVMASIFINIILCVYIRNFSMLITSINNCDAFVFRCFRNGVEFVCHSTYGSVVCSLISIHFISFQFFYVCLDNSNVGLWIEIKIKMIKTSKNAVAM